MGIQEKSKPLHESQPARREPPTAAAAAAGAG